jgi:DNA-binding MarR family transcriptional regulator
VRSAEDRHTVWLTLTEAGHEKLREVWPDHRDSIYLYFGQYLEVAAHNGTYGLLITASETVHNAGYGRLTPR